MSVQFVRWKPKSVTFTADMKKLFLLLTLASLSMICSCQKQNSAADDQVAQRQTELDAREKALNEREKALEEREKASSEAANPAVSTGASAAEVQSETRTIDPEQMRAERERRLQERLSRRQQRFQDLPRLRMSDGAATAAPEAGGAEAGSPGVSPTPQ